MCLLKSLYCLIKISNIFGYLIIIIFNNSSKGIKSGVSCINRTVKLYLCSCYSCFCSSVVSRNGFSQLIESSICCANFFFKLALSSCYSLFCRSLISCNSGSQLCNRPVNGSFVSLFGYKRFNLSHLCFNSRFISSYNRIDAGNSGFKRCFSSNGALKRGNSHKCCFKSFFDSSILSRICVNHLNESIFCCSDILRYLSSICLCCDRCVKIVKHFIELSSRYRCLSNNVNLLNKSIESVIGCFINLAILKRTKLGIDIIHPSVYFFQLLAANTRVQARKRYHKAKNQTQNFYTEIFVFHLFFLPLYNNLLFFV